MKTWNDLIELAKKNVHPKKAAAANADGRITKEKSAAKPKTAGVAAPHTGHRLRMRERFENDPELNTFAEHEVLEMLLFNSVCRKDTNALAHKLIAEFGSLANVMDASFDSLRKAGLNDASVAQIKQVLAVANYYLLNKYKQCAYMKNTNEVTSYFGVYFANMNHECVVAALLDASGRLLSTVNLGKGGPTSTEIDAYKLLSAVDAKGAVRVVLMHNHPAGNLLPSTTDISTTGNIMVQLAILQAALIDHIVFGSYGNYFSFYHNGLISALGERCNAFIGNEGQYLNENVRLLSYKGKSKHLSYESFERLENKILRDVDDFSPAYFDELLDAVKKAPVFGNYLDN